MIAKPHDEERLIRELYPQARDKVHVVAPAHFLASQIFVQVGTVAEIAPIGREIGPIWRVPWEVIGHRVNQQEQRGLAKLPGERARGDIVIEAVRISPDRAKVLGLEETLYTSGLLKSACAQKRPRVRIEAVGRIAAAPKRMRQAAFHPSGSDPRNAFADT